jgi:hypothetical protein
VKNFFVHSSARKYFFCGQTVNNKTKNFLCD